MSCNLQKISVQTISTRKLSLYALQVTRSQWHFFEDSETDPHHRTGHAVAYAYIYVYTYIYVYIYVYVYMQYVLYCTRDV